MVCGVYESRDSRGARRTATQRTTTPHDKMDLIVRSEILNTVVGPGTILVGMQVLDTSAWEAVENGRIHRIIVDGMMVGNEWNKVVTRGTRATAISIRHPSILFSPNAVFFRDLRHFPNLRSFEFTMRVHLNPTASDMAEIALIERGLAALLAIPTLVDFKYASGSLSEGRQNRVEFEDTSLDWTTALSANVTLQSVALPYRCVDFSRFTNTTVRSLALFRNREPLEPFRQWWRRYPQNGSIEELLVSVYDLSNHAVDEFFTFIVEHAPFLLRNIDWAYAERSERFNQMLAHRRAQHALLTWTMSSTGGTTRVRLADGAVQAVESRVYHGDGDHAIGSRVLEFLLNRR